MSNKEQKQEKLDQWKKDWSTATLNDQIELIATHYKSALLRTAHRAFTEGSEGIFASAHMNYEWAQDAMQDALADAFEYKMRHPTYKIRYPAAFFRTLARNSATGIMKRFYLAPDSHQSLEKHLMSQGDMTEQESLEGGIEERSRAQELNEVMEAVLTKEEIELLKKKYVEGEDYEYLSLIKGKSIGTLKSIISRAKDKVQQALEQRWQQEQDGESNKIEASKINQTTALLKEVDSLDDDDFLPRVDGYLNDPDDNNCLPRVDDYLNDLDDHPF